MPGLNYGCQRLGNASGGSDTHRQDKALVSLLAAEVCRSIAAALQANALAPSGLTSPQSGVTSGSNSKQMYDKYNIVILEGFLGAMLLSSLQPIWALFKETKNVETHQHNIQKTMHAWAATNNIPTEKGLFFS